MTLEFAHELLEQATPGPWSTSTYYPDGEVCSYMTRVVSNGEVVAGG